MESSEASENPRTDLYRLFIKLCDLTGQEHRETIDAVVIHEEWELNLRLGCGRVLKRQPRHLDARDDLLQETKYLLLSALVRGKIKYRDRGSRAFMSWLRKVIYHAALVAFQGPRPISVDRFVLMDPDELDNLVVKVETRFSVDDLLIAIRRLKTERTRRVMRHWAAGMSLAESAQITGHTIATVRRIRQRAQEQLRRDLLVD